MTSIVIPAHNEEAVIERCLRSLTTESDNRPLEIVVVCNGCSDRTAEIARSFGQPVRVVETPRASKAHALRLGDEHATTFPRIYLDADVVLSFRDMRRVSDALEKGECLAAAPRMEVDVSGSSWAVRRYYEIWLRLPYHADNMIGSGVYALSEQGRARFDEFPDIISDDGFVRLHFRPDERLTVEGTSFRATAPYTLGGLIAVKTRSQKGLVQLHRLYPELLENDTRSYPSSLGRILRTPRLVPGVVVYTIIWAVLRARAYWLNLRGDLDEWERDDTSRAIGSWKTR